MYLGLKELIYMSSATSTHREDAIPVCIFLTVRPATPRTEQSWAQAVYMAITGYGTVHSHLIWPQNLGLHVLLTGLISTIRFVLFMVRKLSIVKGLFCPLKVILHLIVFLVGFTSQFWLSIYITWVWGSGSCCCWTVKIFCYVGSVFLCCHHPENLFSVLYPLSNLPFSG